jgi:uncharacterized membrane protein
VIILGILLLLAAVVLHYAALWTVGIIVIVVGLVLVVLGAVNHPVGGRRHYW